MNLFNLTFLEVGNIVFLDPIFLYIGFFTCFIPYLCVYLTKKNRSISINFSDDLKIVGFRMSPIYYLQILFTTLTYLLFFLIFANPHSISINEKISKEGIDIIIALDISKSMEANDLQPNRIRAAQKVISDFIDEMSSDRLGITVFAGKPYASVPLTYDYELISQIVDEVTTDSLNQNISGLDGTAIGDALLLSTKILKSDPSENNEREKIIILLTDGDANRGVDPILAVKSLKKDNIKIYTIGVGSKNGGTIEIKNGPFIQKQKIPPLNESVLREIASLSQGKFFRATDNDSLENIFMEISKLEKTEIETEIEKHHIPNYKIFVFLLMSGLFTIFGIHFFYKQ